MNEMPFILIKASGMPMIDSLEDSIMQAGYCIKKIYNLSNGWDTIQHFYLNNKERIEFNLEVEIHAWLEKYLFGEAAYLIFIDTDKQKSIDEKCKDTLLIKKDFRNKFTLSRDGTFMVAMDVSKTPFKPLLKWKKGKLKISRHIFDHDMSQKGVFRGYYFKYAHTPDNVEEYNRHIKILNSANILNEENRIYPKEWQLIKCAIKGDHKNLLNILNNQEDSFEK